MDTIFRPHRLGGLTLETPIVRSATWEGMCDEEGRPTENLINYLETLAAGKVGLIISGYTYVSPEGKQQVGKAGIYTDSLAPGYLALCDRVHRAGGKIMCQLVHAGGQAIPENSGVSAVAPSAVMCPQWTRIPRELSRTDIDRLIVAFADGAERAKQWGFDGVQIHGAHGYLINQFLSPLTNRRTDTYGGSLDNQMRFVRDVLQAIRKRVGATYPVMIKLSADDHLSGGLSIDEATLVCRELESLLDGIEVSSGVAASPNGRTPARGGILTTADEGYNLPLALRIRDVVDLPLMVVGGFRSLDTIKRALAAGMDAVALSRPLICEPNLVARWQKGDTRPALCISCSRCFVAGRKGGVRCLQSQKKLERRLSDRDVSAIR